MLEHLSEEGTARERGLRFGEAQRAAVEATLAAYERLFAEACGLDAAAVRSFGEQVSIRTRTRRSPRSRAGPASTSRS